MRFSYCVGTTLVTAALFLFYFTHYRPFLKLFFGCYTLTALLLFLGTSIVCVNNLMRTADLVLWFPDITSVCTHPWHQNHIKVFMVQLNLTILSGLVEHAALEANLESQGKVEGMRNKGRLLMWNIRNLKSDLWI